MSQNTGDKGAVQSKAPRSAEGPFNESLSPGHACEVTTKTRKFYQKSVEETETLWRNNGWHFYKFMKTINTQIKGTQQISGEWIWYNTTVKFTQHLNLNFLGSNPDCETNQPVIWRKFLNSWPTARIAQSRCSTNPSSKELVHSRGCRED